MSGELERADVGFGGFFKSMLMSNTARANSNNRGIAEYKPCAISSLFDVNNGVYTAVVSGGDPDIRNKAIIAQTECAIGNNFPVVIIHESNDRLNYQLENAFGSNGRYVEISQDNPCFEPFFGLNPMELVNQIIETAPKSLDIKHVLRYYMDGLVSYLNAKKKHASFKMLSSCPHAFIFDKVDDLQMNGLISDGEAQTMKSKLMMGQSESLKLDAYLSTFEMEIQPIRYMTGYKAKPTNIFSALTQQKIVSMDIGSSVNEISMNTIAYQIGLAQKRGMRFVLIIDSISVGSNEAFSKLLKTPNKSCPRTIVSEDLYAMAGGDEKLFSAIVGDSGIMIVMRHSSGQSATKWAETFGQYDRYDETYSNSTGKSREPFKLFSSTNRNSSVSISKSRAFIVQPEVISRLGSGEAYVMSAALGHCGHFYFVD